MATFIIQISFTDQGAGAIRDTCARADGFRAKASERGIEVRDIFWTLGPIDGLIVLDAPDAETVTALMLKVASEGNIRTQTMQAYNAEEIAAIIEKG